MVAYGHLLLRDRLRRGIDDATDLFLTATASTSATGASSMQLAPRYHQATAFATATQTILLLTFSRAIGHVPKINADAGAFSRAQKCTPHTHVIQHGLSLLF